MVSDKETQSNSLEQPRANGIMEHVWLNPKCFWYEWQSCKVRGWAERRLGTGGTGLAGQCQGSNFTLSEMGMSEGLRQQSGDLTCIL